MLNYDAVVIGGGPGGYECAIQLAIHGKKTALIEEDLLGGTCLNRGCIPTKTLLNSSDIYYRAKTGADAGIYAEKISYDYKKIIEHKNKVSRQLSNGVAFLEKNHGVDVIKAHAVMKEQHVVSLSDGKTIKADSIVIATGSLPARLPLPGMDQKGVMDSTGLLNLEKCPNHIVIIGGGVIGVEFATFFWKIGIKVTVVEMLDHILGPFDKDIIAIEEAKLKSSGVELILCARVDSIDSTLCVHYTNVKDGSHGSVQGDVILTAGGRKANSSELGLENIGVILDKKGFVETDGLCRTNIPGIYAIGDVNGKMQLAHVASAQGILVADHIAGKTCKEINLNHVPSCVYCSPEAAMVGLTIEKAKEAKREFGVGIFNVSGNGKALSMGENEGIIKIIYDKKTEEILGCHIIAPHAADLIAEIAAVMECEGTVTEICHTIHPHPSVSEIVMEAAHDCKEGSVNAPKRKK